jgi:hypothetical protein
MFASASKYPVIGEASTLDATPRPSKISMLVGFWGLLRRLFGRTERTSANSAVNEDVFETIFNTMDDWICGLDSDGRIRLANAALVSARCNLQTALIGTAFTDLVPDEARETIRLAFRQTANTGATQACEYETLASAPSGSWRRWTFQRMMESTPHGPAALCLLAIGRDITEQKRLENQLLHSQRVGSIGVLTSGIAHDLNNVLAPIVLSAELLQLHGCSEENVALLEVIATSAQRGAGLVAQMLSFSRGLEGDRQVVDLVSLIKELGRLIDRTFAKNIQLRIDVARDLWRLHANSIQIYQVLLNLCVNARDAMPQGGQLTLTARNINLDEIAAATLPGATAGNYVVLSVGDTGIGIAKEIVDRIFDPFFTTKAISGGTGLGLSTVRAIVKSYGGVVTLATQVGQGTIFHVYFPVHELAEQTQAGPAAVENVRGAGEHVLVVDDEESFCDVARHLLEEFGYVVHVATSGTEAVRIFEEHRSDIAVAIIDLNMPVMDGRTTIRAIRAVNPQIGVITMSGSRALAGQPLDEDLGVRLTKPYSMGTLLQAVRQVLIQR